jgi:septum site-determining protein MinC
MTHFEPAAPPTRLYVRHDEHVPVLVVPDDMPFPQLREWIRAEMTHVVAELGGRAGRLDLGGREILLFDVRRLLHLLRDEFQVEITGLYVLPDAIHKYAERELKLKLFPTNVRDRSTDGGASADPATDGPAARLPGLDDVLAAITAEVVDDGAGDETAPEAPVRFADADADGFEPLTATRRAIPTPDLPSDEPDTDAEGGRRHLCVHRTLRSGATVRYDGDVTVYGDVNPGAQIRAGGNVVVLGRLRGVVHAGANGGDEAFILAFELAPTQLRIGKHIAIAPAHTGSGDFNPEIAQVSGDTILIEQYRGRLRR